MYTCCPICKTNFNVTEAQLQVAQGKVRCGSCKKVFNARQHINYRTLPSRESTSQNSNQNTTTPNSLANKNIASRNSASDNNTIKPKSTPAKTPSIDPTTVIPQNNSSVKKPTEHPNIDAIFNALDTQLSSGTYIDIAKPVEVDIREAGFDEIFNENDPELSEGLNQEQDESLENISDDSESGDLELDDSDLSENALPSNDSNSELEDNSNLESDESIQQHTFDFISLSDEPDVAPEDKEQFATVSKTSKTESESEALLQSGHEELHQAIDNIIKVDNNIPTPFEPNDADHFVIEMSSEPDVELVDENDIDKLFASTDSLKISDLKFDKYTSIEPKEEQALTALQNKIEDEKKPSEDISSDSITTDEPNKDEREDEDDYNQTSLEPELLESEPLESKLNDYDLNNPEANEPKPYDPEQSDPNQFDSEQYEPEQYEPEQYDPEQYDPEQYHPEQYHPEQYDPDFDESAVEEEIILSSPDPDDAVPHRLRDAVASLEQQPVSLQKRILFSIAAFILIMFLSIQLILFKSTAIANMLPILQPLLVSICENLPCRYTGSHNRKQIKIINRDVRLHPKIKGALLISATITNQASYTQPYPTILLKFTDLTGATVAQRYFQPKEYLGLLNKPFALMPSKKPVQLNIEILDPGSDAINFQFFFL